MPDSIAELKGGRMRAKSQRSLSDHEPLFKKTVLKNGVRVLTESHPSVKALCAGIFIDCGTRDEDPSLQGAAHFVEHMVFKGTHRRSAYQIVRDLEAVGGEINAYTHREMTCVHTTTLRENFDVNLDVLTDVVGAAEWTATDFRKERQVILHELDATMDNLEDFIYDIFLEEFYRGHPLGLQILGTVESLKGMKYRDLARFYKNYYRGANLAVSVAGDIEHNAVVEYVEKRLGHLKGGVPRPPRQRPRPRAFRRYVRRPSEHVHVLMGWPSLPFCSDQRFEAFIVNAMLGGGMTSRLYQKIREQQALAYTVYSSLHSFTDSGVLLTYLSSSENRLKKILDIVLKEVRHLRKQGLSRSQLEFYRRQVKGTIILGSEDMENRMTSLGVNDLTFGDYRSVQRVLEDLDKVTVDSVDEYLKKYLQTEKMGLLVMGDLESDKTENWIKSI